MQAAFKPQGVQVRNRLTHGKSGLVQIQIAFEKHRQDVDGAAGLELAGLHHLAQPLRMVRVQLADALMQPGEGVLNLSIESRNNLSGLASGSWS